MEQVFKILTFVADSFVHIWPFLAISIPLAVLIQLSGVSGHINKVFTKKPYVSVFLATAIGAFSPFCSCGVIPVITTLLISGVPLAPVMSFWIASPSMDPEIFFLSVSVIGWKLSVWRLTATFMISLFSGLITHFAVKKGFLGDEILRADLAFKDSKKRKSLMVKIVEGTENIINRIFKQKKSSFQIIGVYGSSGKNADLNCCIPVDNSIRDGMVINVKKNCSCTAPANPLPESFAKKIGIASWKAFLQVAKFMALAFFINAIIKFYLPDESIINFVGGNNSFSVLVAGLIGIPFYTSNITALPLVSGLLSLGMNQGAVLAFLVAGPTTTLPAMMAVWGIVRPRVFLMYLSFSFFGAVLSGYLFNLIN